MCVNFCIPLAQCLFFAVPLFRSLSLILSFSLPLFLTLFYSTGTTNDYDVTLAVDQLLAYLVSDKGRGVRDILSVQLVEILDTLGEEVITKAN